MIWKNGKPKLGNVIRVKVKFYHHYGIFVNENRIIQFGLPDDPGRPSEDIRVLVSDIYTFLQGGEAEIGYPDKEEKKKLRSAADIVAHAEARIGEGGYDLLHNNCEHFVNECAFGESRSSFLDKARDEIRQKLNREKDKAQP